MSRATSRTTTDQERLPGLPRPEADDAEDVLLGIADRIVQAATSRGADAAEVYLQTSSHRSISIERDRVGFTQAGGEGGIGLRVMKGRHIGFAYFSDPHDHADATRRALDVARKAKASDYQFPASARYPDVTGLWDDKVAHLDTDAALAAVRALIAGAKEVDPAATVSGGSVGLGSGATALVNSEGVQCNERGTGIGLSAYVVLKRGDTVTTGFEGHEATTLDAKAENPAAIGRTATELAVAGQAAEPFGDGRPTTVVFRPEAASSLMEFITVPSLYGDKAARGESLWSDKLGEVVTDTRLSLTDDPTRANGLGSGAWDDEGLVSRPNTLIDQGKVARFLYDLGGAYEYADGPSSATGSGIRAGGMSSGHTYQETPSVGARNVRVDAADAKSLDDLIADIDDGILVHDLLGAHTANPTSGDFSVSSTVLFRIKGGALGGAVESVMLAGNFPDLLRDHFIGTSTEREQTSGHFSPVGMDMPYLALGGVHAVGG